MIDTGNACLYLLESPDVQRVELRIAPFNDVAEYVRFFKYWSQLEARFHEYLAERRRALVQFRFAIHFKRTRGSARKGHNPARPATVQMLTELDRESAVLRLALATDNPEHQYAMTALARIDVAGQERDTPISVFVMHMRLLRGDPEMLQVLDDMAGRKEHPCHRFLSTWGLVERRGKERPSLTQPGPGITVHAGEVYADVLGGLYQIGVAVDHLGMRAGDSIGHALALKAPVEAPSSARQMAPPGTQHDSLCWLHDLLESEYRVKNADWNPGPLRDMIVQSGQRLYRNHPDRDCSATVAGAGYDDFVWVWRHKLLPLYDDVRHASALRRDLIFDYEYQYSVIERREAIRGLPDARSDLGGMIAAAQSILLQKIIDRRIVVEMNPSSNIRISGARRAGDSPTVKLIMATRAGLNLLHWPSRPVDPSFYTDKSSSDPRGNVRDGVPPSG